MLKRVRDVVIAVLCGWVVALVLVNGLDRQWAVDDQQLAAHVAMTEAGGNYGSE